MVVLLELDEHTFLFVVEARVDVFGLVFIRESEVDYFSFLSRPHRGRSRCFIREDCKTLLRLFVIDLCGKSYRGPDNESLLYGTPEALGGTLEIGANGDDPLRT